MNKLFSGFLNVFRQSVDLAVARWWKKPQLYCDLIHVRLLSLGKVFALLLTQMSSSQSCIWTHEMITIGEKIDQLPRMLMQQSTHHRVSWALLHRPEYYTDSIVITAINGVGGCRLNNIRVVSGCAGM